MTNKFTVTLAALRKNGIGFYLYNKIVRTIQGEPFTREDEARESYIRFAHKNPISVLAILESNGLEDALLAISYVGGCCRDLRLYAVWCARQVQHLMKDERSFKALDVAEAFANGLASENELADANDDAISAVIAAKSSTNSATWAARAAAQASSSDFTWAAIAAAWDASQAAAWSADQTSKWDYAWDAAVAIKKAKLIQMLEAGEFVGPTKD